MRISRKPNQPFARPPGGMIDPLGTVEIDRLAAEFAVFIEQGQPRRTFAVSDINVDPFR